MTTPVQPSIGQRAIAAHPHVPRRRRSSLAAGALALLAGAIALLSPVPASATPPTRAAALEAWLGIQDDTRVPTGWTGNSATCDVGTESQASIAATLRAVNTLRDFAGVAPVTFDPALNAKALAAAVMMRAAGNLSHYPGPTWPCYTSAGANGANNSNLYLGTYGAQAMTGYFQDLGHRGPMLDPRAATLGTGSTSSSNALYVRGAWVASPPSLPMIAWPAPGHVPWPLIRGMWSVNLDVAGTVDASRAQVQVTIGGRAMAVTDLVDFGRSWYATDARRLGAMLEWNVAIAESERDADATIFVRIDGITVDGAPRSFAYSIDAMRAQVPAPTTFTATRTASAVTIAWAAAVERGVPVTGYQVGGFDGGPGINYMAAPAERAVTLPYAQPGKTLSVTVTPQSRAGYPPVTVRLSVPPPGSGTPPPPTATPVLPIALLRPLPAPPLPQADPLPAGGARARIVGPVTIRLVRRGATRVGSLLELRADVRDARRVTYRWRRDGRPMAATRRTYRVRRADRGRRISCRVTAVGRDGVSTARTSSSRRIPRR